MTNDDTQDLFTALDALLEHEREALLNGNLDELTGLLAEKERLIDRLAQADRVETAEMADIRGKALRNQELMDNAMRGIRSVAERLATLRRLRRTLDTYDQSGRKTTIQTRPGGQVEKRA